MTLILLLGRILYSAIFVLSGFSHFTEPLIQYGASQGVPFPFFLVPLSGLIAILGGLSILLGYKTRYGAWLIVIFLIPVTLMMHPFWAIADSSDAMIQQIMFMKNLSMLGGAFILSYFGSGALSLKE